MTPTKRPRGRPRKPLCTSPFDAPAVSGAARAAVVEALLAAPAPRGGVRPSTALAEAMFPTPGWPRYRNADGRPHRDAEGREREAVERWLGGQPDLHWLAAIEGRQRVGDAVRSFGAVHHRVAEALEAFAAGPLSGAALAGAARAVALLPPDPATPEGQPSLAPLPERLTEERLLAAAGDPAALAALPPVALALAADCRRVAAEVEEWRSGNAIAHGRAAVARDVASVVAAFFDAAGLKAEVRFGREGALADGGRDPTTAYCKTVQAALTALGLPSGRWRYAAEDVIRQRSSASDG